MELKLKKIKITFTPFSSTFYQWRQAFYQWWRVQNVHSKHRGPEHTGVVKSIFTKQKLSMFIIW